MQGTYVVTRQIQWPEGKQVVEISAGGFDYTNPDALVAKYPGEFGEFCDPREALKVAFDIAECWQKDEPEKKIGIGAGYTGGYTMPFEPADRGDLEQWAQEEYENLCKCDRCREIIKGDQYGIYGLDAVFCSEYCAEEMYCEIEGEAEASV